MSNQYCVTTTTGFVTMESGEVGVKKGHEIGISSL